MRLPDTLAQFETIRYTSGLFSEGGSAQGIFNSTTIFVFDVFHVRVRLNSWKPGP